MLRITVHNNSPHTITFQLEGSVIGPWVRELEQCWQKNLPTRSYLTLRVDLAGVTSIDAAGRACLATFHRQGAELVAVDCLMKAVADEITQAPAAGSRVKGEAKSRRGPNRANTAD